MPDSLYLPLSNFFVVVYQSEFVFDLKNIIGYLQSLNKQRLQWLQR